MSTEALIGKQVSIYFDDGDRVTRKDGQCTEILTNAIIIQDVKGWYQLIPFNRVIRVIEQGGV